MVTNWKTLFGGLYLLYMLQLISGDGHVNIQVQVLQYDNPSGTSFHGTNLKSQRKCCDKSINETACSSTDTCDSYFIMCIGGIGNGHCNGPTATTRVLNNMNSFITSHDNTIIHSFVWNHWRPGNMEYIFNMMDKDGARGQELVDNFTSTTALRADMNYEESTTQLMSFQNFVSLDIGLRIWCQDGYTGPDCSKQCTTKPYSICSKNQTSSMLPSCSDTDVLTLPTLSGSTLPVDFTPRHLQQLLSHFILQDVCPDAIKINVTILHFTLTGPTEFKATCNDTAVSSLLFTAHIYILSVSNKAALSQFFPNIPLTTPAVTQKNLAVAHFLMMLNVIEYKDTSSSCRNHECSVDISVCLHTSSRTGCGTEIKLQSKIIGTKMTICGGNLVDSSSASQGVSLVGLAALPAISASVKYNNRLNWKVQNQQIQSYTPGTTYIDAETRQMTLSSNNEKALVLEFMLWCASGRSGNQCEHQCSSTSNRDCDKNGRRVCKKGFHGSGCRDINECGNKNACKNGGTCHNTQGSFTCQCPTGWIGPTCAVDVDECDLGYCVNVSACTNTPGTFHCRCNRGYHGRTCTDTDECSAPRQLCQHGGTCLNRYGSYTCMCVEGFSGLRCENDTDECALSICNPNGSISCNNTVGSYNCNCNSGWTGQTCDTDIDECKSNPCLHGTCRNTRGNYTCACYTGYDGRHCDKDYDECTRNPCANNGTCINLPNPQRFRCNCVDGWDPNSHCHHPTDACGKLHPCVHGNCANRFGNYLCTCDNGWSGKNCSIKDECTEHPCKNNGSCIHINGGYKCNCRNGWTGSNCSSDINECNNSSICLHGGQCKNKPGSYNCDCPKYWQGKHCENDVNECVAIPCKHNGTCKNTHGSFTCTCSHNWTGSTCETDVNECSSSPCKHNGTCNNNEGSYTCACPHNWTGSTCESDINECVSSPCKHNGTCNNMQGSYTCNCPRNWTGARCETDTNECMFSPCKNSGKCRNTQGSYTCTCPSNWSGNHCEVDVNECTSSPCKNFGTCDNTVGSYTCLCSVSWTGKHCDTDVNECMSSPCRNSGNCSNTQGSFTCACPNNWTGEYCETDVNKCVSGPCKNNGTCNNNPGSFTCTCPPNWTGARCETDIDECTSSPCKHSGSCLNTQGNYSCICPLSWMGKQCETDLDECQSSPCINNGICVNYLGSFQCNCATGWEGNNCEIDIDECKSSITPCGKGALCSNTNGSYVCTHDSTTASMPVTTRFSQTKAFKGTLHNHASETTDSAVKVGNLTTNQAVETKMNMSTEATPYTRSTDLKHISISESNIPVNFTTHPVSANTNSNTETSSIERYTMPHTDTNMTSRMHLSETTGISADTTSQPTTSTTTMVKSTQVITSVTNASYVTSVEYSTNGEHNISEVVSVAETGSASTSTISARQSTETDELLTTQHYGTTNTPIKTTVELTAAKSSTTINSKFSRIRSTTPPSTATTVTLRSSTNTTIYVRLEDAVHPRCTNSGWNITVNMSILQQLYPGITSNHIYFGDSTCRGTVIGNHLIFRQGFGDCLTTERISGGTIFYENDLYYAIYDPINPFIIRQHKWTYTVECDVSSKEATSSHVHHDIDAHHSAVSGHYNISMTFFKDPGYMQQLYGNPIHASVGDNVYVKVFTTASDWSIKMRLHTCYTKPTEAADDMTFNIIKDGCEVDSNTHIISQSTHETRFVFQDFEYSTNREGLNIYCNATFCETQDYSPGCAQSCVSHGTQALIGK